MDGSEGPDGMLVGHTTWVACEQRIVTIIIFFVVSQDSSCTSKVQNEAWSMNKCFIPGSVSCPTDSLISCPVTLAFR